MYQQLHLLHFHGDLNTFPGETHSVQFKDNRATRLFFGLGLIASDDAKASTLVALMFIIYVRLQCSRPSDNARANA